MKRLNATGLAKKLAMPCLCSLLLLAACNNESDNKAGSDSSSVISAGDTIPAAPKMPGMDTATVPLVESATADLTATYTDTALTGQAKFTSSGGKVRMELQIEVPAKAGKSVAVHLHEHGDCSDNGKMAHGHWNPTKEDHGKWGTAPFHRGDIGNVKLDSKGKGTLKIETDLWTLGGTADKNILGRAVIVHGGVDDYKTQPTGNAGSRIGCGVIR